MNPLLFVALLVAAPFAYHVGRRHQAFTQAREDVRGTRAKLRAARRARTTLTLAFAEIAGWTLVALVLLAACALARRHG